MNFNNFIKENKELIISAIFVAVVLTVLYFSKTDTKNIPILADLVVQKKLSDNQAVLNSIEAKSFYVYDILDKKPIFSKNEHEKLPLASITKLMSGLVILDIMPETTIVTINKEDLAMEGDSGLLIGEKWKLKDLMDFTLLTSSNDGMHAVSGALNYYEQINNKDTVKIMNEKVALLGLNDTIFINETGLDVDGSIGGAYSSAYDVSKIFEKIIKDNPALISSTNKSSEDFISESKIKHTALNTNISTNEISSLIASKTGFTNLAGGNLAVVFDAGLMHPVVIVVLGSSIEGRFTDVIKLQKIALDKLSE